METEERVLEAPGFSPNGKVEWVLKGNLLCIDISGNNGFQYLVDNPDRFWEALVGCSGNGKRMGPSPGPGFKNWAGLRTIGVEEIKV